jgi:hypothetical protein
VEVPASTIEQVAKRLSKGIGTGEPDRRQPVRSTDGRQLLEEFILVGDMFPVEEITGEEGGTPLAAIVS